MAALDERPAQSALLKASEAAVVGKVDLRRLIANILHVLTETRATDNGSSESCCVMKRGENAAIE